MEIFLMIASQFKAAKIAKGGSTPDFSERHHQQMRIGKSFCLMQQKNPEEHVLKSFNGFG